MSVAKLPYDRRQHVTKSDLGNRSALCETIELASPYFDFVIPVNDIIVWLEAAMMKILDLVDARINVVGEVWLQTV